ncbi:MAG: SAM hydroxide adenosyltransferase [Xanthomonadales bacterium]|nr:SAM hydroxide adenosyltransferase [Xanthomonadales bacterium]
MAERALRIRIVLALALWLQAVCAGADTLALRTEEGNIKGALYRLAWPEHWNGKLLLFAHGLRPFDEPLRAPLDPARPVYREMIERGWMVGATSYRRNGIIIGDAIDDLRRLRQHISERFGQPRQVLLMGDSMGGIIGTLIAERHADEFDAVLASGAALDLDRLDGPWGLNYHPKAPIVFLTNRSEIEAPARYVQRASEAPAPPALWRVERDGHVNVNDDERLAAIDALLDYLETGALDRERDGTIALESASSAIEGNKGLGGTISGITSGHGNIFTSFVPEDLAKLGIEVGDRFMLTVNDQSISVRLGTDYRDVALGEWIGILRAEGFLMLARNRENACRTLNCSTGDRVQISTLDE